jgi:hypothetical protein
MLKPLFIIFIMVGCRLKAITLAFNSGSFLTLCTFNKRPCKYERPIFSTRNIRRPLARILQQPKHHSRVKKTTESPVANKTPYFQQLTPVNSANRENTVMTAGPDWRIALPLRTKTVPAAYKSATLIKPTGSR